MTHDYGHINREAACHKAVVAGTANKDWWFPGPGPAGQVIAQKAVAICDRCPVKTPCLQAALAWERRAGYTPTGIFGGLSANQRIAMIGSRRAAQGGWTKRNALV